jgi:hypothetical protein
LIRGYILETANDGEGSDPKDWKINCRNLEANKLEDIHTVKDEKTRDRSTEKEYRIDKPFWTK